MSACLPAGAFGLAWGNTVAVAGAISRRQQKVLPAAVAAAQCVSYSESSVKLSSKKIRQAAECSLLRDKNFALLSGMHYGDKAHLHRKTLLCEQIDCGRDTHLDPTRIFLELSHLI